MNDLIIGFVSDIMFQTRIESTAERLGARVEWVGSADQLVVMDVDSPSFVESPMLDLVIQIKPQLMIFDLGDTSVPWAEWIPLVKKHPKTKQIPVVCFGSHVNTEIFRKALQTGADEVLARSRFVTVLPKLIHKYVFA